MIVRLLKILLFSLVTYFLVSCSESTTAKDNYWRQILTKPDITQEEFVQAYIHALDDLYPAAKVEKKGPLELVVDVDGYELRSFLDNAWRDTAEYPEERIERCERHWAALKEAITNGISKPIDLTAVVPVIKDTLYIEEIEKLGAGDDPLYYESLYADFILIYAEDSEFQLSFLKESEIEKLNLTKDELRSLAIKNVRERIDRIEQSGAGPIYMLTAGGTFEASILLFDDIINELEKIVDGDLIIAAPSRDLFLFTGSQSSEGIQKLRKFIQSIHEEGSYLISKSMLVRKNGEWREFTD